MNAPNGMEVRALERGLVRVFALSMTDKEAQALRDQGPIGQRASLGVESLHSDYVEVFPLKDLDSVGLAGYLIAGNGVNPDMVEPDRAKLAALEGWVMVVYSRAFLGEAATLRPVPELTLIGTYAEEGVDWSSQRTLTSEAAQGSASPAKSGPSDAAMSGRIASAALLVLLFLTLALVWIAS